MSHRRLAVVLAALLSVAAVSPAFAATQTVTESLTVNATLTATCSPSSISYGSIDAGSTSAWQQVDCTISTNNAHGWAATLQGSDFTAGANTIDKSKRDGRVSSSTGSVTVLNPGVVKPFGAGNSFDGSQDVCFTTAAGASENCRIETRVNIPATQAAGAYAGSYTVTISQRP